VPSCRPGVDDAVPVAILAGNRSLCFVARVCRATEHALATAHVLQAGAVGFVDGKDGGTA
jgi:hypothetical protein